MKEVVNEEVVSIITSSGSNSVRQFFNWFESAVTCFIGYLQDITDESREPIESAYEADKKFVPEVLWFSGFQANIRFNSRLGLGKSHAFLLLPPIFFGEMGIKGVSVDVGAIVLCIWKNIPIEMQELALPT